MTTLNHSALALALAVPTENCSWPIKATVLVGLTLSHLIADALPHNHFYNFAKIKENISGAMTELGGGLVVLPLVVWGWTHIDPVWLLSCILAASLIDFMVAAKISWAIKLNQWAHKWEYEGRITAQEKIRWEILHSVILFILLVEVIVWWLS